MKYAKTMLPLFALGVFACSCVNSNSSQAINAWTTFKNNLQPHEMETTFLNEEIDQDGLYHYRFHIKNISDFYIYDFYIYGEYEHGEDNFSLNQYDQFNVENDIFDYKTLLIGPNQETDVEFCVNHKFLDLDEVQISATGYNADEDAEIATDVSLKSNVLSLDNTRVYLSFETKDECFDYFAILKAKIDDNDYYFVASDQCDFVVNGNFKNRCNEDIEIELVKVVKQYSYSARTTTYNDGEQRHNSNRDLGFYLILLIPAVIAFVVIVVLPIIAAICIGLSIEKYKRQKNKN